MIKRVLSDVDGRCPILTRHEDLSRQRFAPYD
jgi:hypothetical protein